MKRKLLKSLGTRTAIHIFVVSCLIAVVASAIQIFIEYEKDIDRVESRFVIIESSYLPTISSALWQFDEEQARLILKGIKSLPDVAYAEVRSKDSDFFASLGKSGEQRYLTRRMDLAYTSPDQKRQIIGTLMVSLSLDSVINRTYDLSLNILITNVLKTLLLAVYVVYLIRTRITRHLIQIAEHLQSKDQTKPLHLNRSGSIGDELDVMAASISTMDAEIRDKIRTIELHKQELQMLVDEKTKALSKTAETKATLLRVLCHDLSNPLILVTGLLELLENNRIAEDKKPAKYRTVSRAAQLMCDILSNVREMEAVDSGKRTISIKPVDLNRMFDDLNFVFKDRLDQKNISLEIDNQLPENLGVLADPISLSNHVFNNLMSNAIKFSFPGSTVKLTVELNGDMVHVSFKDTGVGMSQEIAEAIFDPTRQTTRPGTAGEKGTGFGMPIVRSFLEKYGGRIEVESIAAEGLLLKHGTTIHLYLKQTALNRGESHREAS